MPKPTNRPDPAEVLRARWEASDEDWTNGVLFDAPDSWDSDEGAEFIALSYVATLEARLDAAGISRDKWIEQER